MRFVSFLIAGAALASCSTVEPQRTAEREQHLQRLTAGKVAAAPTSCVPATMARDMSVIDGRTLAFRSGSRTTHIVHLTQGCSAVTSPGYTLLTRQFGGSGLCRGEIARVVDLTSASTVGSCGIAEIIPFKTVG